MSGLINNGPYESSLNTYLFAIVPEPQIASSGSEAVQGFDFAIDSMQAKVQSRA